MDPRQHVNPGDPIRLAAEQVNGLNRVLATAGGFGGPARTTEEVPYTWMWCNNYTGNNIPQWSIVEIGVGGWYGFDIPPGSDKEKAFFSTPVFGAYRPSFDPYRDLNRGGFALGPARLPQFGVTVECAKANYPLKVAIAGCVTARVARPAGLPNFVYGMKARPQPGNTNNLVMDYDGTADIVWIEESARYDNDVHAALIRIGASQSPQILQGTINSPLNHYRGGDFIWSKDERKYIDVYNPNSSILIPPRASVWNRMAEIRSVPRSNFRTPPPLPQIGPTVGVTFAAIENEWRLMSIAYTYE
jgi:hypothetical protein